MRVRILLVDDNNLFRQGLRALLNAHPDFQVVGDVGGGKEAVQATLKSTPDLVVMDLKQSGIISLETVGQIKNRRPGVKVVILTAANAEEDVRLALKAGANGYVLKDSSAEELFVALQRVSSGKTYLTPDVSSQIVNGFIRQKESGPAGTRLENLTARELTVMQLVAEGRTNRGMAEFLSVSPKTIEKHRATLMQKLGLRNAVELTLLALEMGLVERPSFTQKLGRPSGFGSQSAT